MHYLEYAKLQLKLAQCIAEFEKEFRTLLKDSDIDVDPAATLEQMWELMPEFPIANHDAVMRWKNFLIRFTRNEETVPLTEDVVEKVCDILCTYC